MLSLRETVMGCLILVIEINACFDVLVHWKTAKPSKEKTKFYDNRRHFKEINSKFKIVLFMFIFCINFFNFFWKIKNQYLSINLEHLRMNIIIKRIL